MMQNEMASAQILQFPAGGRAGFRAAMTPERPAFADANVARIMIHDAGEAWYHVEALALAQQTKPA